MEYSRSIVGPDSDKALQKGRLNSGRRLKRIFVIMSRFGRWIRDVRVVQNQYVEQQVSTAN